MSDTANTNCITMGTTTGTWDLIGSQSIARHPIHRFHIEHLPGGFLVDVTGNTPYTRQVCPTIEDLVALLRHWAGPPSNG